MTEMQRMQPSAAECSRDQPTPTEPQRDPAHKITRDALQGWSGRGHVSGMGGHRAEAAAGNRQYVNNARRAGVQGPG